MTKTKYGPWKIGRYDERPVVGTEMMRSLDADTYAYREVIEPKRETVVRYAKFYKDTNIIVISPGERLPDSNLRLHIPLVDGEIEDGAMIRVERL